MGPTKTEIIDDLYDRGRSLDAIVAAVGTDDESIKLIAYRLGLSTKPGTKLDYARKRIDAERAEREATS